MVWFRRLLVLNVVALLVLANAASAFAAKPSVTIEKLVNDVATFEDCGGLTISRTLNGVFRTTDYFDQNGNLIREVVHIQLHGSFTNTANGISLPFIVAETDTINFSPDASRTLTIVGLSGRLTVPGHGLITADVGRLVLSFSGPDDSDPDVTFEAGRHDNGPAPYYCPFIAG